MGCESLVRGSSMSDDVEITLAAKVTHQARKKRKSTQGKVLLDGQDELADRFN